MCLCRKAESLTLVFGRTWRKGRKFLMKSRAKRGMLMNPSVTWLVPLGLPAYIDPAAGENVSSLSFSPLSYIYI